MSTENTNNQNQDSNHHDLSKNVSLKWAIIIILVVIAAVYFILPMLFMLLGTVWPDVFPGTGVLTQLMNGINALVGAGGLIVGVVSIFTANESNRRAEEQQRRHEEFLQKMSEKIDSIKTDIQVFDQVSKAQNTTKKDESK